MKNDELSPLAARRKGVSQIGRGFGRSVLLAVACVVLHSHSWATGGFEEEPLQTLSDYLRLDQLPAKSTDQILTETAKDEPAAVKINFAAELMGLTKKPGPEALALLDKMILAARDASELSLLNLLNDLRDVYAGPANAAETTAYVEWRLEQADQFGVSFQKPKAGEPEPERKAPNRELVADIERHLEKASPALKPHWLYLRGAVEYLARQIPDSQPYFLKVVKDYPKSPRAEAALYMAARTQMWKTRKEGYTQYDMQLEDAERPKAKKLWDEYFAKYPHGRFLGDALGWYAAYAFDGHDFGTALRCYAQQLDMKDHPELYAMAAVMVEKTLSRIASDPKDKSLAEVARHPQAAQALVYIVINSAESDNYNGKLDTIEEVRGWRKKVLPRLATAISTESKLYQNAEWKPRYLAMLAYAASGGGQHDQALKLLQSAGDAMEQSDDLLMANGVVLHRAKRPGEAAKALQTLLEKFPKSPLAKGARLRLALALTDDHRGGEAVLALNKLLPVPKDSTPKPDAPDAANKPDADKPEPEPEEDDIDSGQYPILFGIDIHQIHALIDTLLNFAPVEELAAAAQKPGLDPVLRLQLTEPIAQRLLAKEQFDEAKKFMTPAQFGLFAANLEKLTIAASAAKDPAARAAACLKLGDAWAAARGQLLTYPLDTNERRRDVYVDFSAEANVRRADSAPFVGATGNYKLDLENRDELRHAFNWWLEASDAQPGTPQTAQALWRALKAMPQIADVSPYTFDRAVARKWGDVSRKLYDRLHTECADTVEAKRYAVVWDFTPQKKGKEDQEYGTVHRGEAGVPISGAGAFGIEEDEGGAPEALNTQIAGLESEVAGANVAKVRARVEALRSEVRKAYSGLYSARWVNLVDDLALFLSEPDPGAEVRKQYATLRFRFLNKSAIGGGYDEVPADTDEVLLKDIDAALANPATKPVADYFEFLKLAVTANHFVFVDLKEKDKDKAKEKKDKDATEEDLSKEEDTYRTRDYPKLIKESQAFLTKYPKSKKREAAMLLHARAVYRASEDVYLSKSVTWPRAARWEGGNEPTLTRQEPFDAKRVLAALDAYDKAFPHGLYAPDIRLYRADVAARQHDWKKVLDLTLAQLTGHENPALNGEAAEELGDVFALLADERYRQDILAAIKENKGTREMLEKYLAVESDQNPLMYMKVWLRQQMTGK